MLGLNVSLEVAPVRCLEITLAAGISHPLVFVSFMLGKAMSPGSLVITLITLILDSFMDSPDVDLEVVRPGGLELTEVAGKAWSFMDSFVMSSHHGVKHEHFLTVLGLTRN